MTLELVSHWKILCNNHPVNFPLAPALLTSQFGSGDGPVVYSYVNCMGFEKSLSLCSKTQYPSVTCPANYFAEVRCYEGGYTYALHDKYACFF